MMGYKDMLHDLKQQGFSDVTNKSKMLRATCEIVGYRNAKIN